MFHIQIKPLSVNEAWQGKRFKTPAYKNYEKVVMLMLPKIQLPDPPYILRLEFGFSNNASDWDNPIKPYQDILQKKYGFNDKKVRRAIVDKEIVPKGQEYIKFSIEHFDSPDYVPLKQKQKTMGKFKPPNEKGSIKGMDMKNGRPVNNMPKKVAGIKTMAKGKTGGRC